MKLQNVIYPKEDYAEFTKILLQAAPEVETMLSGQRVIDMYNQLMQQNPRPTMEQIRQYMPKIIAGIKQKIGGGGPSANNLEALRSVQGE